MSLFRLDAAFIVLPISEEIVNCSVATIALAEPEHTIDLFLYSQHSTVSKTYGSRVLSACFTCIRYKAL
jgi:hypothetical protein